MSAHGLESAKAYEAGARLSALEGQCLCAAAAHGGGWGACGGGLGGREGADEAGAGAHAAREQDVARRALARQHRPAPGGLAERCAAGRPGQGRQLRAGSGLRPIRLLVPSSHGMTPCPKGPVLPGA